MKCSQGCEIAPGLHHGCFSKKAIHSGCLSMFVFDLDEPLLCSKCPNVYGLFYIPMVKGKAAGKWGRLQLRGTCIYTYGR